MADRNAPATFTFEQWRVEFNELAVDVGDIANLPATVDGNAVTDVIEAIDELNTAIGTTGFDIAADSGTAETVVVGNTVTFSGTANEIETAVSATDTITIGLPDDVTVTNDLNVGGNLDVTGNITLGGNITVGDADTDEITINADLTSDLIPNASTTYDLGTTSKRWQNLYLSSTLDVDGDTDLAGTLDVGGVTNFNDTTGSTSTTTGAVIVDGGVGIAENLYVGGNVDVTGNITLGGNITVGDADTDEISINADLTSDIIPNAAGTYDLGASGKEWQNIYLTGSLTDDNGISLTFPTTSGVVATEGFSIAIGVALG